MTMLVVTCPLVADAAADVPRFLMGDALRLQQVINNLLGNVADCAASSARKACRAETNESPKWWHASRQPLPILATQPRL